MIRRDLLIGASGLIALIAASRSPWIVPWRYRFRMTVVIDTPKGERSGSGVMEVSVRRIPALTMESHSLEIRLRGQAVAVDIPGLPTLFALTSKSDELAQAATRLFEPSISPGPDNVLSKIAKLDRADQRGRQVVMPKDRYPQLVRFKDIIVPSSVEEVDPGNLARSYGPGFALDRITLTLTKEAVTREIEHRFPWWEQYIGLHLDGSSDRSVDYSTGIIAEHLAPASFSTESFE